MRDKLEKRADLPILFDWISHRRKTMVTTSETKAVEHTTFTLRSDDRPVKSERTGRESICNRMVAYASEKYWSIVHSSQ